MRKKPKKPHKKEAGSILEPQYANEDAAREHLEKLRWPDGPECPHCGLVGEAYKITVKEKTPDEIAEMRRLKKRVRKPRKGLWKCAGCRQQFSVTVKTIFEDSHIPLHKCLLAVHLMCSSKKGISAHQLMRNLDIGSYKTAWFLAHRIRHAMTEGAPDVKLSGIVEADETYIGGRRRHTQPMAIKPGERAQDRPSPFADKAAVFSVVQRGGKVYSRHIERVTADNLKEVLSNVCQADAHLITDTGILSKSLKDRKHSLVNHSADEYVRYEDGVCITTNTVEGFFSILKRGINGVYHHVGRKHLHRYLAEFDFRYNARETTDGQRSVNAIKTIEGKRLMYKDPVDN
jgi:transposase-like protein